MVLAVAVHAPSSSRGRDSLAASDSCPSPGGTFMTDLTRRSALGAAAAALPRRCCRAGRAQAAAPAVAKQVPGVYRYKVGDIEVTVVTDGGRTVPLAGHARAQRHQGSGQRRAAGGVLREGQVLVLLQSGRHQHGLASWSRSTPATALRRSSRPRARLASTTATSRRPASMRRTSTSSRSRISTAITSTAC